MKYACLVRKKDVVELVSQLEIPQTFWERLKGLLGRNQLTFQQGMLFEKCAYVHMIGMKIPLDVIFLDKELRIKKLVKRLKPFQIAGCIGATHTIELANGAIERMMLSKNEQLLVEVKYENK